MQPVSLGRVNVPTPGTPVQLAATRTKVARIRVQIVGGLTGKMYFGTVGVNGATLAGVIKELEPVASGVVDAFEILTNQDSNTLDLSSYWIDAAVAGEGLIVSYWVA